VDLPSNTVKINVTICGRELLSANKGSSLIYNLEDTGNNDVKQIFFEEYKNWFNLKALDDNASLLCKIKSFKLFELKDGRLRSIKREFKTAQMDSVFGSPIKISSGQDVTDM
jgi:hypothetical protein